MAVFDFIEQSGEGSGFVYKNNTDAYYFANECSFTATTGTGTSVMNISAVLSGAVKVGMTLTGGTLSGTRTITSFGTFNGTSGTVNLSGTDTWANPTTVTGSGVEYFAQITDPDYPAETVRGIVYLNGTYYVMTPSGAIYGSDINNPSKWSALNVIQSQMEPDGGVALFRQLNLIVAFSGYSTEFFYDAANPTGSPLLPYSSAFLEIGCASADSIAYMENSIFFVGVAKQKGRSVYLLEGTNPVLKSNPFVDRILNKDDLSDVKSFFIKISGHGFYVLSLGQTGITLVFDTVSGLWGKWTQLSLEDTQSITSASWANNLVTAIVEGHGFNDGDYVEITSSNPTGYNYSGVINVLDEDTFTYEVASNPGTYVGSGLVANYTETFFDVASYTKAGNLDLVQDSTTGSIFAVDNNLYTDSGNPIRYAIRTSKFDGGTNKNKYFNVFELIGDKVDATAYVRYTNDDYQTYSKYRPVDLSAQRSQLYRTGSGRRRAYDIIHYDNTPLRLEAMEITITEGTR
jgi:hypothetical protein